MVSRLVVDARSALCNVSLALRGATERLPHCPRASRDRVRTSSDSHRADIDCFLAALGSSLTPRRHDRTARDCDRVAARAELTAGHFTRSEPDRSLSSPHERIWCLAASLRCADTSRVCLASSLTRTGTFSGGSSALSVVPATVSGRLAKSDDCSVRPPGCVGVTVRRHQLPPLLVWMERHPLPLALRPCWTVLEITSSSRWKMTPCRWSAPWLVSWWREGSVSKVNADHRRSSTA
jgi:hypothetical protein